MGLKTNIHGLRALLAPWRAPAGCGEAVARVISDPYSVPVMAGWWAGLDEVQEPYALQPL